MARPLRRRSYAEALMSTHPTRTEGIGLGASSTSGSHLHDAIGPGASSTSSSLGHVASTIVPIASTPHCKLNLS